MNALSCGGSTMTRIVVQSWIVAIMALTICEQNALFAQEDSNASIMAGVDSNASELAGARGRDLVLRRSPGGSVPYGAAHTRRNSHSSIHHGGQTTIYGPASRVANPATVRFEPFGIPSNQGGLSSSTFRVYGTGYGFGYSRSYFGNYGQGYGTGYSRNYFGNYGYGYGIDYGPKE
jgi:hypothetical protein